MNCKICNINSEIIFTAKVLGKYDVKYYKCKNCSFIQTENPYWLAESYNSAITQLDIGLVNRNIELSKKTALIIKYFFQPGGNFLDFAGGYVMLTRLMRDNGFKFYRQDKYCENIFANSFDITNFSIRKFELLTAFEVFEHLENPIDDIDEMLNYSENILFSTLLQPSLNVTPENWWYVSPEMGQHIAIYHLDTLKFIAKQKGMFLCTNGSSFHMLTKKKINAYFFKFLTYNKITNLLYHFLNFSKNSLNNEDYYYLKNKL